MAVLSVVHHLDQAFLGHAGPPLRAAGLRLDERFLHRGDPLPEPGSFDGLLVLGGIQSAVRADADPVLGPELELLRSAVAAGTPTLGICLGGQMLARALGGSVRHVGRRVGWRFLDKLPAAADDPLFGPLPDPVPALHFNEDVFEAPPGAQVLAGPAPAGVAAFRAGKRAWGLQYHPEVDPTVVQAWITEYAAMIPDTEALRIESERRRDAQAHAAALMFGAFAGVVHQAAR